MSACTELNPYVPCVSPTGAQWLSLIEFSCDCLFPTVCNEVERIQQVTMTSRILKPRGKQTRGKSQQPCVRKGCDAFLHHRGMTTVP